MKTFVSNGEKLLAEYGNNFLEFPSKVKSYEKGEILEFKKENFFNFLAKEEKGEVLITACRVLRENGFVDIPVSEIVAQMEFGGIELTSVFTIGQLAEKIEGTWRIDYIEKETGKLFLYKF